MGVGLARAASVEEAVDRAKAAAAMVRIVYRD
jgi:formate-dependent phosphoribosylglycinamide formyltransferase (GAR transformylase)